MCSRPWGQKTHWEGGEGWNGIQEFLIAISTYNTPNCQGQHGGKMVWKKAVATGKKPPPPPPTNKQKKHKEENNNNNNNNNNQN